MITQQSIQDIINLLIGYDKSGQYKQSWKELFSDLNKTIMIPVQESIGDSQLEAREISLTDLTMSEFKDEEVQELAVSLRNAETAYDYQDYLKQFLLALENQDNIEITTTETSIGVTEETYTITKTFDFTLGSAEGTVQQQYEKVINEVNDWHNSSEYKVNEDGVEVEGFGQGNPKTPGGQEWIAEQYTPESEMTFEGEDISRSKSHYTGPYAQIDEDTNFYVQYNQAEDEWDAVTYGKDHPLAGKRVKPHFYRGADSDVFENKTANEIFIIQQQLLELGLDTTQFNFVPGEVDFQAKNNEISFIRSLMTAANDLSAMNPNGVYINYNAPTLMGQLAPYVEFRKGVNEELNIEGYKEHLEEFGTEVLPPTESEVKNAIDELFLSKGLTPSASDYEQYGGIIAGLRSQAAAREIEIKKNEVTLADFVGLGRLPSEDLQSRIHGKEFQDPGFAVSYTPTFPTAEEAREQLGKPLLTPFDIDAELEKVFLSKEAPRILAGQQLMNRRGQAQQFKSNFMEFEESF
tara:strand:+ start:1841 stop:3403 length:1563 start_codon:yes stop_codon:yes gene_type:complete